MIFGEYMNFLVNKNPEIIYCFAEIYRMIVHEIRQVKFCIDLGIANDT